ncbi:aldo/keto reductase [Subtercola endophyticus]|uniref:aldo/keto reductase n=1 Tax=Subtercola endophyticus TaxID=2895559 RepID=UPI001E361658|nr:aldo/keto reductase [Subtercola endophyticus]UFS61218.1 aldo/keto reductase [Subtercola endophyticus]
MQTRALGRTGMQVTPLSLGAMMFGPTGNADREECVTIIHRALDAGINCIDTADLYSRGESERIVGQALAGGRRQNVVLSTKFHGPMGDDPNMRGASRRWIARAVEDSLTRLGTDYLDVYYVHRPDADTDFDETLGALSDLVHSGKIRAIGTSTFAPSAIVEGQWIAEHRGRERVLVEQPPYSLLTRGVEAEVLPVCAELGLGVTVWGPLAGGWLSGRAVPTDSSRAARFPDRWDPSVPANAAKLRAVDALATLAAEAGLSLIHLALAFVLEHPAVTSALIGPRTLQHLESQLGAAEVRLSTDVLDAIDTIVAPGTTFNPADLGVDVPGLAVAARRRR